MRVIICTRLVQHTDQPFPGYRYVGPGPAMLLLPTDRVRVEDNEIIERAKLVARGDKGYVTVPSRRRFRGTVVMDRLGGHVAILAGEEFLFAGRVTEKDDRATELIFAAFLQRDETLVVRCDDQEYHYTVDGKRQVPTAPAPAQVPAAQPRRFRVRQPQDLIPMRDAPLGYAHVGRTADGQPVWLSLAAFAVGRDPHTGGQVDLSTAGQLLGSAGQPAAPYALLTAAAAATRHMREAAP